MYGWLNSAQPDGGRLRGDQFKQVRDFLQRVFRGEVEGEPIEAAEPKPELKRTRRKRLAKKNLPLGESNHQTTRSLVEPPLSEKLVTDIEEMDANTASYVGARPYLTAEMMQRWGCGWMPSDGGGDKRGWNLRGTFVYTLNTEDGNIIGYAGRDLGYDDKVVAWKKGNQTKQRPKEFRFLKQNFNSAIEIFGQHTDRLERDDYLEFMSEHGIVVVEGFGDVLGLDSLGVPAFGVYDLDVSDEQVKGITRLAREFGSNQVKLMFSVNERGDRRAKEALWKLAQLGLDTRVLWSSEIQGGQYHGLAPSFLQRRDGVFQELLDRLKTAEQQTALTPQAIDEWEEIADFRNQALREQWDVVD